MGTYNQPGDVLTFVAPTGGVTIGVPLIIGTQLVIPKSTVAVGVEFEGHVEGVHSLAKNSGETWLTGQSLYWSTGGSEFSSVPKAGLKLGQVAKGAGSSATSAYVKLNPPLDLSLAHQHRQRCTVAEVNAGIELLPAIDGFKYRLLSASAISIGGAAAAVTTVDVVGVQTTPVLLVAFGQAALTENTELRAGDTGGVILAAGASFVACDENTAISADVTGDAITTATHIDFIITYAIDAA